MRQQRQSELRGFVSPRFPFHLLRVMTKFSDGCTELIAASNSTNCTAMDGELSDITDSLHSRRLKSKKGGSGGGGGGSSSKGSKKSSGKSKKRSGGHYSNRGSGGFTSCTTSQQNVTVGNVTTLTTTHRCPQASPYLAVLAVIPLCILVFLLYRFCRSRSHIRKVAANAQQKAIGCEALHHKLKETNANAMIAAGNVDYMDGWTCDKCCKLYKHADRSTAFYRCGICGIDICCACKDSRPRPGIAHQLSFNYGHGNTSQPVWQAQAAYVRQPSAAQVVPVSQATYELELVAHVLQYPVEP